MKVLKMQFAVAGNPNKSVTLTIDDPKEDITMDMIKEVVPYITAVVIHAGGAQLSELSKAYYETTTTEEIS